MKLDFDLVQKIVKFYKLRPSRVMRSIVSRGEAVWFSLFTHYTFRYKSLCDSLKMSGSRLVLLFFVFCFSQFCSAEKPQLKWAGCVNTDTWFDTRQTNAWRNGSYVVFPEKEKLDTNGCDINDRGQYGIIPYNVRLDGHLSGRELLSVLVSNNVFEDSAIADLSSFVQEKFDDLVTDDSGSNLILALLEKDTTLTSSLLEKLDINMGDFGPQGRRHLEEHSADICSSTFLNPLKEDPKIHTMFKEMGLYEAVQVKNDKRVFYHAQNWSWHLVSDIYGQLHELFNDKVPNDKYFLRFDYDKKNAMSVQEIGALLESESKRRKQEVCSGGNWRKEGLLFVNHAPLANMTDDGSSSMKYFLRNRDQSKISVTMQDLCEKFGIDFAPYKSQFAELEKLHKEASSYGNFVVVTIPRSKVNKLVYSATHGGKKKDYTVNGEVVLPETMVNTLIENPEAFDKGSDDVEYCIPLTYDSNGILNPHSDVSIKSFNAADKEKYKLYVKKRIILKPS